MGLALFWQPAPASQALIIEILAATFAVATFGAEIFLAYESIFRRAYFWFSPPRANYPTPWVKRPLWAEAYKFFDSRKAEEFAKAEKLRTEPTLAISTKNTVDAHDQTTL